MTVSLSAILKFQSTLPVRGATVISVCMCVTTTISIHAPREGSDFLQNCYKTLTDKFQSTLPVRGATAKQHKGTGMFCDKCAIS